MGEGQGDSREWGRLAWALKMKKGSGPAGGGDGRRKGTETGTLGIHGGNGLAGRARSPRRWPGA